MGKKSNLETLLRRCRCRESADRPPPPSAPLAGSLVIIIAANRTKHATRGRTPHQHATSCAHCLYIRPRRGHATKQRHHHSHREVVRHTFSPVRQHYVTIGQYDQTFVTLSRTALLSPTRLLASHFFWSWFHQPSERSLISSWVIIPPSICVTWPVRHPLSVSTSTTTLHYTPLFALSHQIYHSFSRFPCS